ncbi:MAG: transposase [Burkholderiales bacterium]
MPRRPRITLAGLPLHIVQRGNNRSACFFGPEDCHAYLYWLRRDAERFGVRLHAYVLMTNHVHLLLTPERPEHASGLMQALGRRYVRNVNRKYERTGTLWEGRFRACGVHAEDYLLACMRYIELNPVRAGLVTSPELYRWSSFGRNGMGKDDTLLSEHALYTALGNAPLARQMAYRTLFREQLDEAIVTEIRAATTSGHLLATEDARRQAEASLGRQLGPAPRGRPARSSAGREGGQSEFSL